MHVAIDGRVISDHFPGIGRYVYQLVDALVELAPEARLTVVCTPGQRDARYDLTRLARRPTVHLRPVAAPVFGLNAQWRLPRLLRAQRADVFHATYWVTPYWPGVPTVLSLYDLIGPQLAGSVPAGRRLALSWAIRLALRSAGQVITLSEASRRDLLAWSGLPAARVTVTPLAADGHFRPAGEQTVAELRARLGLPRRYVLYVGINKPHKNVATLVEAWQELSRRQPEVIAPPGEPAAALVIAGRWDARYDDLRRRAEALGAAAPSRFLGSVAEADLPALYSGAAVFAFPSRLEGFGLPPLEAMACGTPVVVAGTSSLPEVVGDAGLLVAPDDVAAWASALARVLTDRELAATMSRRSRAQAAGFSWSATAARTLAVYAALAAGSRTQTPGDLRHPPPDR
jgi:alpha-1,3-rhamnosyl/mannosyltransferase